MYTGHYISHLVDSLQPQYRQLFVTILRCATSRVEDKELLSRNRRKSAKHRGSWVSVLRGQPWNPALCRAGDSVGHRHASCLRCSTPGALAPVRVIVSRSILTY